jgi:hypothetical protein
MEVLYSMFHSKVTLRWDTCCSGVVATKCSDFIDIWIILNTLRNFVISYLLYSASHSRVAPEHVGLQKEQKYNTFACHTCNEVRLCFFFVNSQKGSWQHEKIRWDKDNQELAARVVSQSWGEMWGVGLLPGDSSSFLQLTRDDLEFNGRVYNDQCECGQVYSGRTGHLIGIADMSWRSGQFNHAWGINMQFQDTST